MEKTYKNMQIAIEEAKKGLFEGGIPIGSVLVAADGKILGKGHNKRVQNGSCVLHAEMDCLENAGAILLYKIPRVIVGENKTFQGPEEYLKSRGVEVEIQDNSECKELMRDFIAAKPNLWNEDIGV